MVFNPQTANGNGCGHGRCMNCALSLVCCKSPYCKISDPSSGIDLEPLITSISEGFSYIGGSISEVKEQQITGFTDIKSYIDSSDLALYDKVYAVLSEINNKLDEVLSKIPSVVANNEDGGLIVPYSEVDSDSAVLVEKKNLFGKSKWVEEKK